MNVIKAIEHEQMKNKIPKLKVGDSVKVHIRVIEGTRERIQVFHGIILKQQGTGVNETFTVRRISYGVGVEKTFLIHSPNIEKVEVVRIGKARRAKLNYLRDRVGKSAKTKERIGARIETLERVIKEDIIAENKIEEVVPGEESVVEEAILEATTELAKPEPKKEEKAENEVKDVVEEANVQTENPVVEEVTDTVTEEKTDVATDEVSE
jgi:large subunit ribosomal protein L19